MRPKDANKTINFFTVAVVITVTVISFGFGFKTDSAQLPVEAGLGEACDQGTPCQDPFFCSGGVCIQCQDNSDCTDALGESCINGVCTLPGGNNAGDSCVDDSNCKSGTKCGPRKICEAAGGFKNAFNFSCKDNSDCASGLFCNSNGRCVECGVDQDCVNLFGDPNTFCDQGVCSVPKGKAAGGWCTKDTHCASGKCSESNVCVAAATGGGGEEGGEGDWMGVDITIEDVANIIEGLACWLTRIATAIMVIFLVLAGLRFMNARGNPTAYQAAVKNFKYVLIGILVIMAVYVIIATIAYAVGRTDFSLIPLVC
jgi:hypothetical protein